MRVKFAKARTLVGLAIVMTLGVGCGGGSGSSASPSSTARPSSPAKLSIVSPTNGEVVHGSSVDVKLDLTGARIIASTTKNITPTTGHVHLLVDHKIVSMNYTLNQPLGGLKPGTHVLEAEFVASDHLPFNPRVTDTVGFQVKR
jgi:hypothetical protein